LNRAQRVLADTGTRRTIQRTSQNLQIGGGETDSNPRPKPMVAEIEKPPSPNDRPANGREVGSVDDKAPSQSAAQPADRQIVSLSRPDRRNEEAWRLRSRAKSAAPSYSAALAKARLHGTTPSCCGARRHAWKHGGDPTSPPRLVGGSEGQTSWVGAGKRSSRQAPASRCEPSPQFSHA